MAELLKATWRETRRSVLHSGGLAEFHFRQYLFACQARVLLKLGRPQEVRFCANSLKPMGFKGTAVARAPKCLTPMHCWPLDGNPCPTLHHISSAPKQERLPRHVHAVSSHVKSRAATGATQVAERGLKFVQTFSELLARRESAGALPRLFRQAWAFSACLSLATTAARHHSALRPKTPNQPPPGGLSQQQQPQARDQAGQEMQEMKHRSVACATAGRRQMV